jgi:lipid-A-disaccharide synthase
VKRIAELVDKMLVIFPFEAEIYRAEGLPVEFVGHPLLDALGEERKREEIAADLNIPLGQPIVGLLPGSRRQEVSRLLPIMLKAAKLMKKEEDLRFVLPRASTISSPEIDKLLPPGLEVRVVAERTYEVMALADLILVASGTATLEAACLGTPMLIIYKVSLLNWILAKSLIKVPHLGLVNVVAERKIVPEFLQFEAEPRRLASATLSLLRNRNKQESMKKDLSAVRAKLGRPGASLRAARQVLETIKDRG